MISRRNLYFPLLIVAATACAYLNSFHGVFQFDDYNVIVNNSTVHSWHAFAADLSHGIRPLLKASYTLNWTSGLDLAGFHLVNLAIHTTNALLVYLVAARFIEEQSAVSSAASARGGALAAALIFALHPVQTEAVTYICGRSVSLMALFYLASLYCYVRGSEPGDGFLVSGVSPALFIAAALTKEVAVTLPAALLLWESTKREPVPMAALLRRQGIHWLLLAVAFIGLIFHPRYGDLLSFSFEIRSLQHNLLSQINGIGYLLSHLFLSDGMNIDPELPVLVEWTPILAMKGLLLAAALLVAVFCRRHWPWLTFAITWFFLHLLPTNSLVPRLDIANDRQLYLPMIGVSLLFGVIVARLAARKEGGLLPSAATAAVVLVLAIFTVLRNNDYRSEIALWRSTSLHSPGKARVFNNLGYAYFVSGRYREARESYLTALRLEPDFGKASANLSDAEAALRRELALNFLRGGYPLPLNVRQGQGR